MKRLLTGLTICLLVLTLLALSRPEPAEARPRVSNAGQDSATGTPSASAPTPAEIITAVNNLRLSKGLNALTTHPVLMQVAAEQASALAASEGAVGHERPCGMTLGQDLLRRGYPLLGDLSMDGYRSENWGVASTAEDAISMWLGDDEHTNTMLSSNRTDIGAAVAVSDQIYVVLETAMSTSSGQMQYDAYPILTGIPQTQTACYGMSTQAAIYGLSPQAMMPVLRNTALPNGDVIHEVKYGQTLWTLAIQYGTTIAEIKRLNRLNSDVISPGMKLLIKIGATQPAPDPRTPSPSPVPTRTVPWAVASPVTPSPSPTASATSQEAGTSTGEFVQQNGVVIVALVISFSVLMAGLGVVGKKRKT